MKPLEDKLRETAKTMEYPETPSIVLPKAQRSRQSKQWQTRLAVSSLVLIIVMGVILTVQPVQALFSESAAWIDNIIRPPKDAPPADESLTEAAQLSGELSLDEAQQLVDFSLYHPEMLGLPDHVYHQTSDDFNVDGYGSMIIMTWLDGNSDIDYALYQFDGSLGFYKGTNVLEVTNLDLTLDAVLWIDEPHVIWFETSQGVESQSAYLVENPVLVWETRNVVYRLEGNFTLYEARSLANQLIKISESE